MTGRVIVITSGKGGVGKTTTNANIGTALARAGKKVLAVEKLNPGGQIAYAPLVENYPGIPALSGAEFANTLLTQAEAFGAEIAYEEVLEIKTQPLYVKTDFAEYFPKAVIIAAGAEHRHLGLPEEEMLIGAGVSYCATCDGAFFKGKDIAMVGGGNSALQEAVFLSGIVNKVYLIHRRNEFRADKSLVAKLENISNIEVLTPYTVEKINETNGEVSGIKLSDGREIQVSGVFVAIGADPQMALYLCPFVRLCR